MTNEKLNRLDELKEKLRKHLAIKRDLQNKLLDIIKQHDTNNFNIQVINQAIKKEIENDF